MEVFALLKNKYSINKNICFTFDFKNGMEQDKTKDEALEKSLEFCYSVK